MKRTLLIITLIFCGNIWAQNLTGKYCIEWKEGEVSDNCIVFSQNNLFKYRSEDTSEDCETCDLVVPDLGAGHYAIKDDKLILNFDLLQYSSKSYHNTERIESDKDSVVINFKAFDLETRAENWFIVNIGEKSDNNIEKNRIEDIVTFKFKKSNQLHEIEISSMHYATYTFYFTPDATYNFNVYQEQGLIGVTNKKSLKFKKIDGNTLKQKGKKYLWKKVKPSSIN